MKNLPSGVGDRPIETAARSLGAAGGEPVSLGPLLASGLTTLDACLIGRWPPWALGLAVVLLLASWRRSRRLLTALGLAACLAGAAGRCHLDLLNRSWAEHARADLASRARELEERSAGLAQSVVSSSSAVAGLAVARAALRGDRQALPLLFDRLEQLVGRTSPAPALAVHTRGLSTVAWAGRVGNAPAPEKPYAEGDPFVLADGSSATLVSRTPIRDGGAILGFATAELPLASRPRLRGGAVLHFDVVGDAVSGAEVVYSDAGSGTFWGELSPVPSGVAYRDLSLRSAGGRLLALARIRAPTHEERSRELLATYRRAVSAFSSFAFLLWSLLPPRRGLGMVLGLSATRLSLLLLTPPFPAPGAALLSREICSSAVLGPLARSPLDLLLSALWLAATCVIGVEKLSRRALPSYSALRALAADILALPLIAALCLFVSEIHQGCPLDLDDPSLLPGSAPQIAVLAGLVLTVGSTILILAGLFSLAGTLPASATRLLVRPLNWAGLLWVLGVWPSEPPLHLPPLPALGLYTLSALLGACPCGLRARWLRLRWEARAGLAMAATAALSLPLQLCLANLGEARTRRQVEREHAPLVRRQPDWRRLVLGQSQRQVDALGALEETNPNRSAVGLEELAFEVWAATDMGRLGLCSAIEIQDPTGLVVSRFAFRLPALWGPEEPLPGHDSWVVSQGRVTLASVQRPVLHASRRLTSRGRIHGAVHLYLAEDHRNLSFIADPDPYFALYRTPAGGPRARRLGLLAYAPGGSMVFGPAAGTAPLNAPLAARLAHEPGGFWTTLEVDGRTHHAYVFAAEQQVLVLYYPRAGWGQRVADLVEAGLRMLLLVAGALCLVMLGRTCAGKPGLSLSLLYRAVGRRFALRLFVAFVGLAVVPVAVLQILLRGFVADRLAAETRDQALQRAAMAKKAVEDFALFQRGDAPGSAPVTDAALIWVASVIGNDLDVFDRGRLRASSRRELYSSGLLPPTVPASVFRAIVIERQPWILRTQRVGELAYQVASVRLDLATGEPVILSIPLALRQREVETVLRDLDRATRLSSVAFLVLAAALAHSMARRISGPIGDLTRATRWVAAGRLDARVAARTQDELRVLVDSFNQMACQLERQREHIQRADRLAAWAEMARQVAHEVKNPLTPIQLSAEHLRKVYRDPAVDFGATLATCTANILKQVSKLRMLVTEFSAFARPPSEPMGSHDLGALVREACRPYEAVLPPGVTLAIEVPSGLPEVRGDRRLLERAVVNLLENALDAVQGGGAVQLRLRAREPGRVEIEVEDSGAPPAPEVATRAFEPSFSTKTGGSGLGLALVKKIAEDHGGGVSLVVGPGHGTRAALWLPVAAG